MLDVKVKSSGADLEFNASTAALVVAGVALIGGGFLVLNKWLNPAPPPPPVQMLLVCSQATRASELPASAPAPAGFREPDRVSVGFVPVRIRNPIYPRYILSGF